MASQCEDSHLLKDTDIAGVRAHRPYTSIIHVIYSRTLFIECFLFAHVGSTESHIDYFMLLWYFSIKTRGIRTVSAPVIPS
jgi:hypothetical protein